MPGATVSGADGADGAGGAGGEDGSLLMGLGASGRVSSFAWATLPSPAGEVFFFSFPAPGFADAGVFPSDGT